MFSFSTSKIKNHTYLLQPQESSKIFLLFYQQKNNKKRWEVNHPRNDSDLGCSSIGNGAKVNDDICTVKMKYICEYDDCKYDETCASSNRYFKYNNGTSETYGSPGQCTDKKFLGSSCGSHMSCDNTRGLQCTQNGCQCYNSAFDWNTWFLKCSLIPCKKGWTENCTKCLKEITTTASSLSEARAACKAEDPASELLTIKSDQSIAFLKETYGGNAQKTYWVF
jgi:hypothetical protein